jgi:hypothetical protein
MEGEATWKSGIPIAPGEFVYVADRQLSVTVTMGDAGGTRTEALAFDPGDILKFILKFTPGSRADLHIHFQELSGGEEETTPVATKDLRRSKRRGHGARRTRDEERPPRRRPRRGTGDGRADCGEEEKEEVRLWSEINAIIQTLEGDDSCS